MTNSSGLGSYDFKVVFNPQVIRIDSVQTGDFASPTKRIDNVFGQVLLNAYDANVPGPTGNVVVAYLNVTAVGGSGSSTLLDISITTLSDSQAVDMAATDSDGTVTVS